MAFTIGTVRCQCAAVMCMPTDSGVCEVCGVKKSFFGHRTFSRLEAWAKEHSETHTANGKEEAA